MNVIICGGGEVGTHAAESLTRAGHNVTVIDNRPAHLREIEDSLDVRTLLGNCANADVLREAGAEDPDAALVAATSTDEINLLTAAVAKGIGVGKAIARVHHSAYFNKRGLDYEKHLHIDRLICPEYSTAQAIASILRNPTAMAIENFGSGQIEMQEFPVGEKAEAVGKTLVELSMPQGVRLAAIRRGDTVFLPVATTEIEPDDVIILVGNHDIFHDGRKLFQKAAKTTQRVVIMGGSPMAVWLSRSLKDSRFSIRVFEPNRARAEELADKLDWVTIVCCDVTEEGVFEEERVGEADAFVSVSEDDEHNILAGAWAKTAGVKMVIATVQRPRYVRLLNRVGIDHAFSPRIVAVKQIKRSLDEASMLRISTLAKGVVDVYRVRVGATAEAIGKPLRKVRLSPDWMVAAIQHNGETRVPTADDFVHAGDTVVVVGKAGAEDRLHQVFDA
ncbi:MAG: Trk system potassium transporter TrkA [Phycisphaera sp.]|nr:Trk system potassium transporter TrkA [Phycisphaera sp.]